MCLGVFWVNFSGFIERISKHEQEEGEEINKHRRVEHQMSQV